MIAYGCCVGSWEKLSQFVVPRIESNAQLIAMSGQSSITTAYNTILDDYRKTGLDALVLLHDDLEITDPDFREKILEVIADPNVALVGVAGGSAVRSLAWWDGVTVGHQMVDSGLIDFGTRAGDVEVLEGSLLVLSPWAIENMCFDPRYTGFHGYDDIGMVAHRRGKRVVVVDVDTHHHTVTGFKSEDSARSWSYADQQFRMKWGL